MRASFCHVACLGLGSPLANIMGLCSSKMYSLDQSKRWCLIFICIAGVIAAEAVNTSIEKLSNYHTMEIDARIRDVKDIAAGAVLVMAIGAVIVGCLIILPKIYFRLLSP